MSRSAEVVNLPSSTTTAALKNVALCTRALERAMQRPLHLPGLVAFYGPSGWGKSVSAAYAANKYRAYYVQCASTWTRKYLLLAMLSEMGVAPARTIPEIAEQVAEQLVLSNRPLIIDEMDHLVDRNAVELVRDIYEASNAPILLIGEEHLESRLRRWERFHNRMLDWIPAQPVDLDDVRQLARLYSPEIMIADALLDRMQRVNRGAIRRICINIERVRQFALAEGLEAVDADAWGERDLFTGEAPKRRV